MTSYQSDLLVARRPSQKPPLPWHLLLLGDGGLEEGGSAIR